VTVNEAETKILPTQQAPRLLVVQFGSTIDLHLGDPVKVEDALGQLREVESELVQGGSQLFPA